ncbi:sigma-70 family RNA polymerase sigma factor [Lactobacillus delbrueckii]|uniref:sigma-70 family RNA polymerase sigma factor n=1 Tax=Lactobacillus delbrueckii TaxID=1584 RepID=UPI0038530412
MNMPINQAMDQAWERRKLVAGALKTAHVYRKCADYEDLFQEGLIVYAQCLQEMTDKPQEEADKLSFRKVYWRILDLLRQKKRQRDHDEPLLAAAFVGQADQHNLLLKEAWKKLSTSEKLLLGQNLLADRSLKETADLMNIPYRTASRIKKQALEKLRRQLA